MAATSKTVASIDIKRLRRTLEPEQKTWNDDLLETPWEDVTPPLSRHTVFAMKNIFFFSHATSVQAAAIPKLSAPGTSCIVEAPTGCGKTLAFLVPVMERLVSHCDAYTAANNRPLLTRNVVSIILSPSRVLAEQTFVVARSFAARFPHNVHVALCDGLSETPQLVVEHLAKGSRGGGIILVSTPTDIITFLEAYDAHRATRDATGHAASSSSSRAQVLKSSGGVEVTEELLQDQDEETRQRYLAKLEKKRQREQIESGASSLPSLTTPAAADSVPNTDELVIRAHAGMSFMLIVDEADVILRAQTMRDAVVQLVHQRLIPDHRFRVEPEPVTSPAPAAVQGGKTRNGKGNANTGKKRGREEASTAAPISEELGKAMLDVGLFGATAGYSTKVQQFSQAVEGLCATSVENIFLRKETADSFVSQLSNRYCLCEAQHVLHTLIHFLNLHPCKKHFIFFNSSAVLQFVKVLLTTLGQGTRPILFIKHIYAMYEEMKESTKFEEYNSFLQHTPVALASIQKAAAAKKQIKEEKNPHFQSGWKREGRLPPGTGAVLLCTDVAAFGLDVRDVDYVFHFEPPVSLRSYVHRIGRVGRMGMRGTSVLLLPVPSQHERDVAATQRMMANERKGGERQRYNTIANTKSPTAALQGIQVEESDLAPVKAEYLAQLQTSHKLERQSLPPVAPLTAMIRAVIAEHRGLIRLGRNAVMQLCKPRVVDDVTAQEEDEGGATTQPAAPQTEESWYDLQLALDALLLD